MLNKVKWFMMFSVILTFFIFAGFQSGCVHTEPRPDKGSDRITKELKISDDLSIFSWESGKSYWHLSSFRLESKGKIFYIDPVDVLDDIKGDYIFITHSHPDHFSIPDLKKIIKDSTVIIGPKKIITGLSDMKEIKTVLVKPGEKFEFADVTCETVPAYNFVHQRLFHFTGYILTINGIRIYHAGDTGFINEMKNIKNINVAMVPIGTGILAMKPEEAARAVNIIKPTIAIPMHYELNMNKAEKFKSLVDDNIRVEIMEQEK
jgi:L-ascorbate metabolism protein UlaG (beta-lactamase superfamily)